MAASLREPGDPSLVDIWGVTHADEIRHFVIRRAHWIVVVPILRVGSAEVSAHEVIRLLLNTGRVIEMSPRHPTANGTPIDREHRNDSYGQERTYDILPASSTGTYFAAGALVGSSLAQHRSGAPSERLSPAR